MSYSMCSAMDVMVDAVRVSMRQISALGQSGHSDAADLLGLDPRFGRGQDFLDKHDSWLGWGAGPLYGENCVNAVAEGQSVLDGLNGLLHSFNVSPVTDDIRPVVTPGSPLDDLKPIVMAGAVIAGVVLLYPIVAEVLFARKAARRSVAGYRRRSRR